MGPRLGSLYINSVIRFLRALHPVGVNFPLKDHTLKKWQRVNKVHYIANRELFQTQPQCLLSAENLTLAGICGHCGTGSLRKMAPKEF